MTNTTYTVPAQLEEPLTAQQLLEQMLRDMSVDECRRLDSVKLTREQYAQLKNSPDVVQFVDRNGRLDSILGVPIIIE